MPCIANATDVFSGAVEPADGNATATSRYFDISVNSAEEKNLQKSLSLFTSRGISIYNRDLLYCYKSKTGAPKEWADEEEAKERDRLLGEDDATPSPYFNPLELDKKEIKNMVCTTFGGEASKL